MIPPVSDKAPAGACAPAGAGSPYSISKVTVTLAVVEKEPGEK